MTSLLSISRLNLCMLRRKGSVAPPNSVIQPNRNLETRRWAGGGGEPPGWGPGDRWRASPGPPFDLLTAPSTAEGALPKSCSRPGSLSAAAGEVKGIAQTGEAVCPDAGGVRA